MLLESRDISLEPTAKRERHDFLEDKELVWCRLDPFLLNDTKETKMYAVVAKRCLEQNAVSNTYYQFGYRLLTLYAMCSGSNQGAPPST